jgi:expansin (peptidoglycan-binding protein)
MIKKLLFTVLGLATLTAGAQMNAGGDGFTLDNTNGASNCFVNSAPNNGGIMSHGNTTVNGPNYQTASTLELVSEATIPGSPDATWFGIPVTMGSGETATCGTLNSASQGIDMTSNSRVTITAQASTVGAVLNFYLGGEGQWFPASSTYNTGSGVTIDASHTFTTANADETFTFDFAALDAVNWPSWAGRSKIQSVGYGSATGGATFKINKLEIGATASSGGGDATCSDGIMNQDETGVDCGGASCSPCGGGGGNGVTCIETKDDGLAQATYYTLLETGASSVVTCSFDAVNDIKGTFYGALETATLHGPGKSTPATYCGMCVSMTGIKGTHTVQITDECPDCHEHNSGDTDIDLSTPAFAAIVGDQSIGRSDITWKEVPCPWSTPLQVIVQGSNQWYAKVIIANHVNRIASVEVEQAGAWYHLTRGVDNGWVSTGVTTNELSKSFKITDIYGEVVTVSNISFSAADSKNYASVAPTNFPACGLSVATEGASLNYVSVYPNPAENTITLEGLDDVQSLQIVNLNGQVVLTQFLGGAVGTAGVDIANLTSGIYVVKLTGTTTTSIVKFVKK